MEFIHDLPPRLGAILLGIYLNGAETILENPEEIDPDGIRKTVANYYYFLNVFRDVLRVQEVRVHEIAIGRLEQFFEIEK